VALTTNHLKEVRESLLISKSELARKAGVSLLTIGRIEKGLPSRNETKRKILAALGLKPSQKDIVFSRINLREYPSTMP
jgi:DNA-binding XRE family transcriptional regulator